MGITGPENLGTFLAERLSGLPCRQPFGYSSHNGTGVTCPLSIPSPSLVNTVSETVFVLKVIGPEYFTFNLLLLPCWGRGSRPLPHQASHSSTRMGGKAEGLCGTLQNPDSVSVLQEAQPSL